MTVLALRSVQLEAELPPVDLEVEAGESVGLVCPDQEFGTRLVRVLAGLDRPFSGTVEVFGVDISTLERDARCALRTDFGYVPAEAGVVANLDFAANVALPLRYHGVRKEPELSQRIERALDDLGLLPWTTVRAGQTLPALQKRLAYARAVALEPRLLLSEDPSSLLDPQGRSKVARLLKTLPERGTTCLAADDDIDFIRMFAQRILLFFGGRIFYDGPVDNMPPLLARTLHFAP
ncbi:MAG: ATP-binding cassette domain-containing protein [Deltaproteobacteria bacterium]|nr:MAG: ATP-binding cassette domain-containing protein [Deltaproteobacteria bacterium]